MQKFIFLFLSLSLIFIRPAFANIEYLFKGTIKVDGDKYSIFDEYTQQEFTFFTYNHSIFLTISQLETDDYISGSAFLDPENRLRISSIDFVGLKRLLGLWSNNQGIINFQNFNDVSLWNFEKTKDVKYWGPFNYIYSITPDDEGKWKIFFSDEDNVILALLNCADKNHITISIYNSNDGSIDKVYELERP
jgi:hypothetical protein